MISSQTAGRVGRLGAALSEHGIDAFFGTSAITMGYLQGFFENGHERFLTMAVNSDGRTALICPSLSENQARRAGIQDIRPWRDGQDPVELFKGLAEEWGLKSGILAVDDEMRANILLDMQAALPAALFKAGQEVLASIMRTKDEWELQQLKVAGSIADRALPAALAVIKPGVTEQEVSDALAAEMRRLGGQPSFCIVAAGAFSAEPHHLSDSTQIKEGDVVVLDFGCSVNGYQSDITRTVSCGKASAEAHTVYDVVLKAHQAARRGIRAGATCGEIDQLARKVIDDAGFGEFFIHRTGHGIGMRGHEEPYIIGGSEIALLPGDCFSIEPGIYLPLKFGVRIENIVAATDRGEMSMNDEPSETLIEVV